MIEMRADCRSDSCENFTAVFGQLEGNQVVGWRFASARNNAHRSDWSAHVKGNRAVVEPSHNYTLRLSAHLRAGAPERSP
jgi:hypothetical protein